MPCCEPPSTRTEPNSVLICRFRAAASEPVVSCDELPPCCAKAALARDTVTTNIPANFESCFTFVSSSSSYLLARALGGGYDLNLPNLPILSPLAGSPLLPPSTQDSRSGLIVPFPRSTLAAIGPSWQSSKNFRRVHCHPFAFFNQFPAAGPACCEPATGCIGFCHSATVGSTHSAHCCRRSPA